MASLDAAYREMKARRLAPEACALLEARLRSTVETEMQTIPENRDNARLFVEACALGMKHVVLRLAAEKAVALSTVAVEGVLAAVAGGQADLLQATLYPLPAVHSRFTSRDNDAARRALGAAFLAAATAGDVGMVQALLACRAMYPGAVPAFDPAADGNAAFRAAAAAGRDKVVAHLLTLPAEFGIRADDRDNDALRTACKKRRRSVLRHLLKAPGVDVTVGNNVALLTLCENGDAAAVRDLLATGAVDPAAEDNEALCRAAARGRAAVVETLLSDARVCAGARDNTPLRSAAKAGHLAVVRALLAAKAPGVDPTAPHGECEAFHAARVLGHDEVAVLLARDARLAAALGLPVQQEPGAIPADATSA